MARRISGERSVKIGKKTYTLRLGFDEMSQIEDRYGSMMKLLDELCQPGARLSLLAFIFSQMAGITETKAFALSMEFKIKVYEGITSVLMATLNPESEKSSKSGE